MTDELLVHVILAERVGVTIAWGAIGFQGLMALYRVAIDERQRGDLGWASLFFMAAGLLIFQWQALTGQSRPEPTVWVAIALGCFILCAAGIFYARALKAPEGHQRAALLAHFGVLVLVMSAGALSS